MERPKTATTVPPKWSHSELCTSHNSSEKANASLCKSISIPLQQLRTSLFNAFGATGSSKHLHNSFRNVSFPGLERTASENGAAVERSTPVKNWKILCRRSSVRFSGPGRTILRNRVKNDLDVGDHNHPGRLDTPRLSESSSWLQKLPLRRREYRSSVAGNEAATDVPEHTANASDTFGFYEDDRAWDIGLGGGAAARAAAAAQNELLESTRHACPKELQRLGELKLTSDSESGIGIELRDQLDPLGVTDASLIKQDPAVNLPEELFAYVLLFLDARSLIHAEMVSRRWSTTASSCHLWRNMFTSEYGRASAAGSPKSLPGHVGGYGFGRHRADQQWKSMWKARKTLQSRWSRGHAAAIYLEGHQDTVYCVQFDEKKILTGSRDRTIRVWDATTFECIKILGVPKQNSSGQISAFPKDRLDQDHQPFDIVTPLTSGRVLRYPTAEESGIYHHGSVLCLQFDETVMVTGSSDNTLIMWDVKADWRPKHRMRHHRAGVLDVCFDAEYIVSCSKDTTICIWSRSTGALLHVLVGHRGPVNAVQLRGELIVSASGDGVAKLWNITSGICVKEFPSRDRGLACVEFSPDCRTVFAGGNDQLVYQFDAANGELVRELRGHSHLVRSLHLDYLNGRIISGSYDHSVKVYDVKNGEMICNFPGWTTSWILSAKADYRRIVATSQDKRVVVMDFGHGVPGVDLLRGSA